MNADVTVREVMDREYLGVSEPDDLVETVELLLREGVDTAVVLRGSEPVGVLTCRDVMALLVEGPDPHEASVGDGMTAHVPTVDPKLGLEEAANIMSTQDVRRLVVTRDAAEEPDGIITEHDVFAVRARGPGRDLQAAETSGTVAAGPGSSLAADVEPERRRRRVR